MKYHVNIKIDTALELLGQDKNPFSSTPLEAFHAMMDAKSEGKTHYTGCDRMDAEGKCRGHVD